MKSKTIHPTRSIILLLFVTVLLPACAAKKQYAEPGQQLQLYYSCYQADGSLVETNQAAVAGNDQLTKSVLFQRRDIYRPVNLTVPVELDEASLPPFIHLEERLATLLASQAAEFPLGQQAEVVLADQTITTMPEKDRTLTMARRLSYPARRLMAMDEFRQRYGQQPPQLGDTLDKDGDFPGLVESVSEEGVTLLFSVQEGASMDMGWTTGLARLQDDTIIIEAQAQPGDLVKRLGGLPGRISKVADEMVTIDFGQRFAGQDLQCQVVAEPAATQPVAPIAWHEDLQQARELASEQQKAVVLVLYADWCTYCHKLFDTVLPDQALANLRDDYIWVKINSDKQQELAQRYGQTSFPLLVLESAQGKELARFSGLPHITSLAYELERCRQQVGQSKKLRATKQARELPSC